MVILGNRVTIKRLACYSFYGLLFGIVGIGGLSYFIFHFRLKMCVIMALLVFIIVMFIIVPIAVMDNVVILAQDYIKAYQYHGYYQKLIGMLYFLIKKEMIPRYILNTAQVKQLILNDESFYFLRQGKRYQLKMTYVFKDQTKLDIYTYGTYDMKKKNYEAAFQLLEQNQIDIIDPYHLRSVLFTD